MSTSSINFEKYFVPSDKAARKKWMSQILDSVSIYYGSAVMQDRRMEYWKAQQFIRGEYDREEYSYIWNTWGIPKPMQFVNYPLLETHIDGLVGTYLESPMLFDVWKVNENATSQKMDMKTKLTFMTLAEPYFQAIEKKMGVNLPIQDRINQLPDSVKKYMSYDVRDMMEEAIFYDLYDLIQRYNIQAELANCLNDGLENGFMFGKILYDGLNPYIKHVPIENAICDLPVTAKVYNDTSNQNILGEDNYFNEEEIFDKYSWILTESDLEKIKGDMSTFTATAGLNGENFMVGKLPNYCMMNNECYARVIDIQVRAYKNLQLQSEAGEPDIEPKRVEKQIKEVHCGVKIGQSVYRTYKKKKQISNKENYADLQMDYFGAFTKSNLYRKGKGFQMLYNVINMAIEFLVNQAGGKAVRYNLGSKPEGMEEDDITYNAKVGGIIYEQPQAGSGGTPSVGGEIDFGLGAGFQYMTAAKKEVESSMYLLTGVNPNILGQASQYSSGKLNEQQILQGTVVTAPIFHCLTKFTELGLQRMSDLVKYLHAEDSTRSVVIGDMGLAVFQTTKDQQNYDYGIYAKNFAQVKDKNAQIMNFMNETMSTNPLDLIDAAIKMVNAQAPKEKQKILENAVAELKSMKQKMQQHEMEVEGLKAQAATGKIANDKTKADAAKENPTKVATIMANSRIQDTLLKQKGEQDVMFRQIQADRDKMLLEQSHEENMQQNEQPQPQGQGQPQGAAVAQQ